MPKIKAKKTCENIPKEITEYPKTDVILYTDGRRSYHYRVKKEDSYCVETTWGRGNNKQTVECSINYIREKPFFRVMYGSNFSEDVCSNTSPTAAANAVIRKLFPNNEKTLMSGIHLFGIHLETLKQARESKRESNSNIQLKQIKPIEHCGKSMIYKRQRKFGDQLKEQVQIEGAKIYGKDQVILKQISYNVKHMGFQIAYGSKDDREKEKKLTSIVQVIDQNYMSREGYRALIAVEPDLEREWIVSEQRLKITKNMNQKIEITLINIPIIPTLDELDFVENSNIFDYGITDEIKNITNGGHRSAKDILTYIIPALIFKGVLDISNPIIHLRISGDGRNVGRKIKQVMITMGILNDEQNIHKPDHHYTTILFPGIESYELLEVMMSPFIQELNDLKNYGLKINNIIWKFELYFSSTGSFCLYVLDLMQLIQIIFAHGVRYPSMTKLIIKLIGRLVKKWRK
ncbi:uncharacterized protein OCT59_019684 [Rhizophagus irregularis]|uniref:uncharacterized protein n=1 Tax=Rhizophagus irregularis TaxID=588596 RepID=UPI00332D479C|nr:hypothetical protein OCT59_019684 [Rhizophagus irregularis]